MVIGEYVFDVLEDETKSKKKTDRKTRTEQTPTLVISNRNCKDRLEFLHLREKRP